MDVVMGMRFLALAGALAVTTIEHPAAALGANLGVEGGVGTRTNMEWGPMIGAHLELRPIQGLLVGAYVTDLLVDPTQPANDQTASFVSIGGRIRYIQSVAPRVRIYGMVGLGYVIADYPPYVIPRPSTTDATQPEIEVRKGNFLEIPVGAGAAFNVFKATDLTLNLAWRPGVAFRGAAYEGPSPYAKPTHGFSATLGLSFFF